MLPLVLVRFLSDRSLFLARLCWWGGGGSVAIIQIRVYTSDIVIGTGIVDCTWGGSQTVVRGRLATACCRRGRLPPDGWWSLAVAGGSVFLGVYSQRE